MFEFSLQGRLDRSFKQFAALFWIESWGRRRRTQKLLGLTLCGRNSRAVWSHRNSLDGDAALTIAR
jgi:hypothetical protein